MNILFLVRRYNDLDHIAPIIYKLAEDTGHHSLLFTINPSLRLSKDYRARYLVEKCGTVVDCIYRHTIPKSSRTDRSDNLMWAPGMNFVRRLVARVDTKHSFLWRIFSEAWARQLLGNLRVEALVVDWQKPGRHRSLQVLSAARQLGIPVIAVPHAIPLQTNDLITRRQAKRGAPGSYEFNSRFFDLIIAPHEEFAQRLIRGDVPHMQIRVAGSARFCDEWKSILKTIAPHRQHVDPDRRVRPTLNVVFFDHDRRYRINPQIVESAVERISRIASVNLIVVPGVGSHQLSPEKSRHTYTIDQSTDAFGLIAWSDVVMTTASSIVIDAILLDKVFVYPKYFHDNEMVFEKHQFCRTALDDDQLAKMLEDIWETDIEKRVPPSHKESIKEFMTEVVYGGKLDRDVLTNYVECIEKIALRFKAQRELLTD
jgi:hypothetical protein